jgi:hypothetical protein
VFTSDIDSPVEWSMAVLVDVTLGQDYWFDRASIGESLEPDEWEKTHG